MSTALSQFDREDLKSQGFTDEEINKALKEIEQEDLMQSYNQTQQSRSSDPRQYSQHSAFSTKVESDLVKWQLELNDILERAEHILRGDRPVFKDGHMIWEKNENLKDNVFNETGIQEIMKILAMYVNRNTILSDYENDEIQEKVLDFGKRVNNLIFMRYEKFGIDTEEKKKEYEMIVGELVDIVHSSYKRALKGGERRSLREMIQVSQNTSNVGSGGGTVVNMSGQQQKSRGMLNPMRYVMGKYY